jgi:hypothetical protein
MDPPPGIPSYVQNLLYYVGPYANFDLEVNPVIVVHDRLRGVYILNLKDKKLGMVVEARKTQPKWTFFKGGGGYDDMHGYDFRLPKGSALPPDYEDSSDDENTGYIRLKNHLKGSNEDMGLRGTEPEKEWERRFTDCDVCTVKSAPLRNGIIIDYDRRIMAVTYNTRVDFICYEAQRFDSDGLPTGENLPC